MTKKGYSQVHHLGYVVRDLKTAMVEYGALFKIPQWYIPMDETPEEVYYKGNPLKMESKALIGYCGSTEIELISFTGGDENIYSQGLEKNGEGFHHISFFVKDMEAAEAEWVSMGYEKVQWGTMTAKSTVTRYAYFVKSDKNFNEVMELNETRMRKSNKPLIRGARDCFLGVRCGDLIPVDDI